MEANVGNTATNKRERFIFYLLLSISITVEVVGASFMPLAAESWPYFIVVLGFWYAALILYIYLTNKSEVGIISAVWTGGGTALITISGILLFGESLSLVKLVGIVLIIIGVVGINAKPFRSPGKEAFD